VIINQEVLVSAFVRAERLGYVIESYNPQEVTNILEDLKAQRGQYGHIAKLQGKYTWEVVEPVLITAHLNN
jgi:predicted phosphohydrolase